MFCNFDFSNSNILYFKFIIIENYNDIDVIYFSIMRYKDIFYDNYVDLINDDSKVLF